MNEPLTIWYATYGSNLLFQRFRHYLHGGIPSGSTRQCFGAIDSTEPIADEEYFVDWQLKFARKSKGWGNGGVAFLHPPTVSDSVPLDKHTVVDAGTICRRYLIKFDQFIDVLLQENNADPSSIEPSQRADLIKHLEDECWKLKPGDMIDLPDECCQDGWYRSIARLGAVGDKPVLTLTTSVEHPHEQPSPAYITTIMTGLLETSYWLEDAELIRYVQSRAKIDRQAATELVQSTVANYVSSNRARVRDILPDAVRHHSLSAKVSEASEAFRVVPTDIRHGNRGEFIAQLNEEQFSKRLRPGWIHRRKRELLSVAAFHPTADGRCHREFRVLATLMRPPRQATRPIADYELAMDQKLRVAIGAREGDWVVLYPLSNRSKSSFIYWLIELILGTQPQLMRVSRATLEDMEIDIARIPETTFHLIGTDPGGSVAISSTQAREHSRTGILTSKAIEARKAEKRDLGFFDPSVELRLARMRGVSDRGEGDLPTIHIDYDARERLKIQPGDPVRVVRDCLHILFKRINFICFPVLLGLAISSEHLGTSVGEKYTRLSWVLLLSLTVVILEVRLSFRRRSI